VSFHLAHEACEARKLGAHSHGSQGRQDPRDSADLSESKGQKLTPLPPWQLSDVILVIPQIPKLS